MFRATIVKSNYVFYIELCLRSEAYHCTGNITEWTKCQYKTQKPKRKPFKVPKEYHDVPFLQNFKFVSRERVFASKIDASLNTLGNGNIDQPLKGLKFVLLGKTSKSQADLTNNIVSLGGEVAKKVDKTTAACISSKSKSFGRLTYLILLMFVIQLFLTISHCKLL